MLVVEKLVIHKLFISYSSSYGFTSPLKNYNNITKKKELIPFLTQKSFSNPLSRVLRVVHPRQPMR